MGFKSLVGIPNMKMKKLPPEAKRGRATDRVKEGYGNARREAIATSIKREAISHGRNAVESKPRADGQEPNRRPTRRVEGAQHSEDDWYARGGKFGGSAEEQRAITWGDLTGVSP